MTKQQIWPEGQQFTLEVNLPTRYEPLPVEITYIVPPFDVVVEMSQNKDPDKAYPLFRQFIIDWDQEDKLTDDILISFLVGYPGTDKAIFAGWCEHMKGALAANNQAFAMVSNVIN